MVVEALTRRQKPRGAESGQGSLREPLERRQPTECGGPHALLFVVIHSCRSRGPDSRGIAESLCLNVEMEWGSCQGSSKASSLHHMAFSPEAGSCSQEGSRDLQAITPAPGPRPWSRPELRLRGPGGWGGVPGRPLLAAGRTSSFLRKGGTLLNCSKIF